MLQLDLFAKLKRHAAARTASLRNRHDLVGLGLMRIARGLWFLAIARLPFGIRDIGLRYAELIGCSGRVDCKSAGVELLLSFDLLEFGAAFLLWPLCFWYLGGSWLLRVGWRLATRKPRRRAPAS